MADTKTLLQLRAAIRERYELDGNYVSDSVLNVWINASLKALRDLIIDANPEWLVEDTPWSVAVVSGTSDYALSGATPDVYKIVGVDVLSHSNVWRNMLPWNFAERNKLGDVSATDQTAARYRLIGSVLRIVPVPGWTGSVRVWYVANTVGRNSGGTPLAEVSADTDYVEFVNGWEEYVVADCCIKAAAKEETDPSVFALQRQEATQRILLAATTRDEGEPDRIRDVDAEAVGDLLLDIHYP